MMRSLRVGVGEYAHGDPYHRAIYDLLADSLCEVVLPAESMRRGDLRALLRDIDVFHLHWPEWLLCLGEQSLEEHRRLIASLRECRTRVLWTQHNLEPHRKGHGRELYRLWAPVADGIVHHTHWGAAQSEHAHAFRADALRRVIPHPHFGELMSLVPREEAERRLALTPCPLRLGVIGAPRVEKDVQLVLDAVASCQRQDVGLWVACLRGDERVPEDPRIQAVRYQFRPRELYDLDLSAVDALVLPFRAGMLNTGTVFDAIGAGLPVLTSNWPFLGEVVGDAAIRFGATLDDLRRCVETLDGEVLARAASGMRALQPRFAPSRVAAPTRMLLEELAFRP